MKKLFKDLATISALSIIASNAIFLSAKPANALGSSVLAQAKENAEFYYNRGSARANSGDIKGGIEDYNQALKINPNYAEAYNSRGYARASSGDIKGATEDFNQALKINPNLVPINSKL
ncbi:MAG: tetratricopeptide repeat protein [Richelia sp. RM2_1_2]|nr:tetratricopeptide repeat protein [Richelia sp. SM2_1_7]NJM22681.1 tetratricopeptide repeat protein [Richelia sp. SM1_7_0]NJN07703.1 tetratricopeptide repeat protein [Richelia sp. RM1_1_1]NJO27345.1 tetratricopeptide repeat protein [Richelia sp. SL_2_1]NJO63887.1 tetratricopeptide repeat protein [Richelia sp. RM2_1_2]